MSYNKQLYKTYISIDEFKDFINYHLSYVLIKYFFGNIKDDFILKHYNIFFW